ncbi:AsmA-like C-terminal region-containing protein [Roseibium litorale]|uniref:AsmA family protein n=1 Tax=Roseibium litorale TaxID=2803841 RepID=A0ABR9CJP1_9HYPH|nr:AsmA-like C-terminal region-containing protein [Roseibium litorale]MBD8890546.1 AsmA family protein [Roseibium litorale]
MGLNSVYITIGVAIILVLVTALVGPLFVDWSMYRSTFESYAERTLGHKVTVLGDADLQLLPSPSVTFTDVRVGEAEDPLLVVSRFQMRIELPPLLKGEIRVLDMELERPHLTLGLDEAGRLDWLTAMGHESALSGVPADDVAFENVTISDGAISIIDARNGVTRKLDNANLLISGRSLAGPFKVDGTLSSDGNPYSVRISTGRRQEDGAIRVKADLTPSNVPVTFSADGLLAHETASPVYEGSFSMALLAPAEEGANGWSAKGQFKLDASELDVPSFDFRYGPEDRTAGLEGRANLTLTGAQRFDIRGKANQLDLDRLFGGGPQKPAGLPDAVNELTAALAKVPVPDIRGVIALDVPSVVVGGGLVQDVRLDLETMLGGWRVARLAARMPGRTTIATDGDLGLLPDVTYRGNLSLTSDQPGSFVSWWKGSGDGAATMQPVSVQGRLSIVPGGAALDDIRLGLDGTSAKGGLSYRQPVNGNPEFSLSLDADTLDVDQLETLAGLFPKPVKDGDQLDVSLRVSARQVHLRGAEGTRLELEAGFADGSLRIDRLYADDLAGAEVDVSGQVSNLNSAPEGALSGTLAAKDLGGIISLLEQAVPDNALVRQLAKASYFMVPARFNAQLDASASGDSSDVRVSLDGTAGGVKTSFKGSLKGRVDEWHEADIDGTLKLSGPDGGQIFRQLGFDILPVDDLGQGELTVSARGRPEDGLDVSLQGNAGEASLTADGSLRLMAGKEPVYKLAITASVPDLSPFALLTGHMMPVLSGEIPADVSLDLNGTGTAFTAENIAGTVAGVTADGRLEGKFQPATGETSRRVKGTFNLSSVDFQDLSEAILGADQWASAGNGKSAWPSSSFGNPLFGNTDLTLDLSAGQMLFDRDVLLENMRTELRLTPTMMRLDGLSGGYAGGKLNGSIAIRRSGAEGSVSGHLKLADASLQSLVWQSGGRSVATGDLNLVADFEGAGRSIAAMVSGLTGGGTFQIRQGELRNLNPQAFGLVMRAADAGMDLDEDKIRDLFLNYLDAGSLSFDTLEGALTIVGGRASARNISVDSKEAGIFGSAQIDLNDWTVDSDFSLKVDPGENAVTGADPQVGLLFTGPLDAPVRTIDTSPFTAFLTLRAFEQEVERVEKLQSEILERDRLMRELKREKQERDQKARDAELKAQQEADATAARKEDEARQAQEAEARAKQEALDKAAAEEVARKAAEKAAAEKAAKEEAAKQEAARKAAEAAKAAEEKLRQQQTSPANRSSAPAGQETPAGFAERIRSVIQNGSNDNTASGGLRGSQDVTGSLPPLEAPQSVEDLLNREFGLPADTGTDLPQQTVETPAQESRRSVPAADASGAVIRPKSPASSSPPRYKTLSNGLVVTYPSN